MKRSFPLVLSALLAGATGCSPAHSEAIMGPAGSPGSGYEWPPRRVGDDDRVHKSKNPGEMTSRGAKSAPAEQDREFSQPRRARATPHPLTKALLDEGACLDELGERDISYSRLDELQGVRIPVQIRGSLGGVHFYVNGNGPLYMDCRLAVALDRLEPVFRSHGVTKARFSGAYVYKTTRSGRLSHHAHGLALDLHEFWIEEARLSVKRDFARGMKCDGDLPPLNSLSCDLQRSGIFHEFLTPDYDADHYDHLHVSVPKN